MKNRKTGLCIAVLLLCLVTTIVLCGCETAKGMGRDIKCADQWVRDHMW